MKIFAIADLHLSMDMNVDKPMDIFGMGWENHALRLEENWRNAIDDGDIVILPGDLSWGLKFEEALSDLEWIHSLSGNKVIFKGNHDLWWNGINKLNSLYEDMHFVQNEAYLANDELAICGTRGWILPDTDEFTDQDEKIYLRELRRLETSLKDARSKGAKEILAVMHYPPAYINNLNTEFTDLLNEFNVKTCIYGHLHGANNFRKALTGEYNGINYKLVSLDYLGAKPKLIYDNGFVY